MSTTDRVRLNRHRLEKFSIGEVSAVDDPAQIHASALIQKRESDKPMPAGEPFLKGSGNIVAVSRQLSKEEKTILQSAQTARLVHDPDTQKILDGQTTPLTSREQAFYATLRGDARRKFILADHDNRNLMLAAAEAPDTEEDTDMTTYANKASEASGYDQFSDAVDRIAAEEGVSKMDAMRIARARNPEMLAKVRFGSSTDQSSDIAKAHAAGRSKQAAIDTAVARIMKADGIGKTEALRKAYSTSPQLFAD